MKPEDTYIEECGVCGRITPCVTVLCTAGHLHHSCLPCIKGAEAHGHAIEVEIRISE